MVIVKLVLPSQNMPCFLIFSSQTLQVIAEDFNWKWIQMCCCNSLWQPRFKYRYSRFSNVVFKNEWWTIWTGSILLAGREPLLVFIRFNACRGDDSLSISDGVERQLSERLRAVNEVRASTDSSFSVAHSLDTSPSAANAVASHSCLNNSTAEGRERGSFWKQHIKKSRIGCSRGS